MTTPSGPSNFEYSDDSVVARLAFDVPPQALTDVTQLTQALQAMAVQQEYIARSTGSWLDYMQQVPQIMERANQAYRESITQLERMAYIQNEMSGGAPGGNIGVTQNAGPQGSYSTAAPAGYVNPFSGMSFGMGSTPDLMAAQQHMAGMASSDPRMYANMMAARGMAVNPTLLGMVGGVVAGATGAGGMGDTGGGQGWGGAAPGSQSPQATQTTRDSAAPPDPTQGGQSTRSEPQNIPAEPHPDSPKWVQAAHQGMAGAQQILNETAAGGGGRASTLLALASAGMNAASKWSRDNPDAFGGLAGKLGPIGKGVGAVSLAAGAAGLIQRGGEQIQQYEQLGSVQGGGVIQGVQYEAQARMLALNPFITTQQARTAMQMALSQGFQGGEYDTVMDYMLENFRDMGVQFSTSMKLARAGVLGGQDMETATQTSEDLLRTMHELSSRGGASFTSRQAQAEDLIPRLTSLGVDPESAQRALLASQEGYGDKLALRDEMGRITGDVAASPMLNQLAAQRLGITGLLPGALPAGLAERGVDPSEVLELAAAQIAQYVSGYPERANRIAAFQALMAEQGVRLDWPQAEALYDKVTGDQKPSEQALANLKEDAKKGPKRGVLSSMGEFVKTVTTPITKPLGALDNVIKGDWPGFYRELTDWSDVLDPRGHAERKAEDFEQNMGPKRPPARLPENASQAAAQSSTLRTEGQVSGEVRITIDQQGRASAPATIQLSGQQKSALAGYGSAQLNNAPPGDPTYHHAYNAFPGGQ